MKYYKLMENIYLPGRWYLGDVIPDDDNWKFTKGIRVDESKLSPNLQVEIEKTGKPLSYTITEAYFIPVVSQKFKIAFESLEDVQFISVDILGVNYYLMVVCSIVDCVDEVLSEFDRYTEDDLARPDKAGDYKSFYKLKLDPIKIRSKIFRLKGYEVVIIVNEEIKKILDEIDPASVRLVEV